MNVACPRCGARWAAGAADVCLECLLAPADAPVLLGEHLELLEEIGRGGMGAVYKARDRALDRLVAVKFLPERPDDALHARLEREARLLACLDHPGVVKVFALGFDEGRPYVVMEYVEGGTLADLLPLAPERAVDVLRQLCDALEHAHAQGIVHRDIKPENVLVDRAGRVRLGDFGIARLRGVPAAWSVTSPGQVPGTPRYMAPELREGAPPDPRQDVFGLGVLLTEMINGRAAVLSADGLSPALAEIVRKATATDPLRRYADVTELRQALASYRAPPERAEDEERQWLRAVALLFTVATAAVLWALVRSLTPRLLPSDALEPLVMIGARAGPDGRMVSLARFETGAVLAALAAIAAALGGYGLLWRHWRSVGFDACRSDEPMKASRHVFLVGLAALALFGVRRAAGNETTFWTYAPLLGGTLEVAALFLAWVALLTARRRQRPLRREPGLWSGLAAALIPPVVEFLSYLRHWRPE